MREARVGQEKAHLYHDRPAVRFDRRASVSLPGERSTATSTDRTDVRPASSASRLYERDAWLRELTGAFARAWPRPGAMIVEGAPGLGKTAMVNAACRLATEAELGVLLARGSEHEADCRFGVARQVVEPVLLRLDPSERSSPTAMAAARALSAPTGDSEPEAARSDVVALVQLLTEQSTRTPLLVAVDDMQWCDPESAVWLHYLVRRLESGRTWFVGSTTPYIAGAGLRAIDRVIAEPLTRVFPLKALTRESVTQLVGEYFAEPPDAEFLDACYLSSGGNPFLLFAVLAGLRAQGARPAATSLDLLGSLAPPAVARSVLGRLVNLPVEARALLEGIALLGDQADVPMVTDLAGIDATAAGQAADTLVQAQFLHRDGQLRFVYPLERSTVHDEMGPGGRARAHAKAARLLAARGVPAEEVADHLLMSDAAADDWSVECLEQAAAAWLAKGRPASALRCLNRALLEPPSVAIQPRLLVELASTEAALGLATAVDHLRQAADLGADAAALAEPLLRLVEVLPDGPSASEAIVMLEQLRGRLEPHQRPLRLRLEVAAGVMGQSPSTITAATAAVRSLLGESLLGESLLGQEPEAPSSAERLALAHLSFVNCCAADGTTATEVADQAQRALEAGELLIDDVVALRVTTRAILALVSAGRFDVADRLSRLGQAAAVQADNQTALGDFSGLLAHSLLVQGALGDAEAVIQRALVATRGGPWLSRPMATEVLSIILSEQGRTAESASLLRGEDSTEPPGGTIMSLLRLGQRGRLHLLHGRFGEALGEALLAGERAEQWRIRNPAVAWWRATASAALHAMGQSERARDLAADNLELAKAFDSRWALGIALRVAADAAQPAERLGLLGQAVEVLETSGATLEYARATVQLGAALGKDGQREAARRTLRRGADLAFRGGAAHLADQAARELRATGARPRRLALTGAEALTPAERRVTNLAALGESNSGIAQTLFVTEKTVEGHLARAYQKLGIRSRRQLPSPPPHDGHAIWAGQNPDQAATTR